MIDTIVVKFHVRVDPESLCYWDKEVKLKPNGRFSWKYVLNSTTDNGAMIKCTYYPMSYDGFPLLLVDFSIPHVVFGNNIKMNYDINQAVEYSNAVISGILGIPKIDLWDGTLHRLDIFYNHDVGDLVPHYIKALQQCEFSHRTTEPYLSQGTQYRNKQKCTKFYDKEKECKSLAAFGLLRQETCLHKMAIQKLTQKEEPTLRDISRKMLANALRDDLKNLNMLGNSIGTCDSTLKILCGEYGTAGGIFCYGLLKAKSDTRKKELAISTGLTPRSLNRWLNKISKLGVPLIITENINPLPPLYINEFMDMDLDGDI